MPGQVDDVAPFEQRRPVLRPRLLLQAVETRAIIEDRRHFSQRRRTVAVIAMQGIAGPDETHTQPVMRAEPVLPRAQARFRQRRRRSQHSDQRLIHELLRPHRWLRSFTHCRSHRRLWRRPESTGPQAPEVGVITLAPRTSASSTSCPAAPARFAWPKCARRSPASCRSACSPKASEVKAGEQLYQIDSATYRAALSSARSRAAARRSAIVPARCWQTATSRWSTRTSISQQAYDDAFADRGPARRPTWRRRAPKWKRRASTSSTRRCWRRSPAASAARS